MNAFVFIFEKKRKLRGPETVRKTHSNTRSRSRSRRRRSSSSSSSTRSSSSSRRRRSRITNRSAYRDAGFGNRAKQSKRINS